MGVFRTDRALTAARIRELSIVRKRETGVQVHHGEHVEIPLRVMTVEGRDNLEPLQRGDQGACPHGLAVVGVQHCIFALRSPITTEQRATTTLTPRADVTHVIGIDTSFTGAPRELPTPGSQIVSTSGNHIQPHGKSRTSTETGDRRTAACGWLGSEWRRDEHFEGRQPHSNDSTFDLTWLPCTIDTTATG